MSQQFSVILENSSTLGMKEIPVLEYDDFYDQVSEYLKGEAKHCVAYYGVERENLKLIFCIADDLKNNFRVYSFKRVMRIRF